MRKKLHIDIGSYTADSQYIATENFGKLIRKFELFLIVKLLDFDTFSLCCGRSELANTMMDPRTVRMGGMGNIDTSIASHSSLYIMEAA